MSIALIAAQDETCQKRQGEEETSEGKETGKKQLLDHSWETVRGE